MSPDEKILNIAEIGTVPYLGLPECKNCPEKQSEVIQQRIHTNTGEVVFDTHLQCKKITFCKNIKEHWMAQTKNQIINGDGKKPIGISRAEALANG